MRTSLLAVFAFYSSLCIAQKDAATHGTINVILANGNGAVVLSDSRLSSNGRAVGLGTKLFKLDDTTVCVIAGFYSDPGPHIGGRQPGGTTIPEMLSLYPPMRTGIGLRQKLATMSQIFQFDLGFVARLNQVAKIEQKPSKSVITLVGYEGERLAIIQAEIVPQQMDGVVTYQAVFGDLEFINDALTQRYAGITDVATDLEFHPEKAASDKKHPAISLLGEAILRNHGQSLTLEELKLIALDLGRLTALRHPNEVGFPWQVSELTEGKIKSFESYQAGQNLTPLRTARLWIRGGKSSYCHEAYVGAAPPYVNFADHVEISYCGQTLDDLVFANSTFKNVHLYYNGAPMTFLDSTNILQDCDLTLGPLVNERSPFIVSLRENFPELPIMNSNGERLK